MARRETVNEQRALYPPSGLKHSGLSSAMFPCSATLHRPSRVSSLSVGAHAQDRVSPAVGKFMSVGYWEGALGFQRALGVQLFNGGAGVAARQDEGGEEATCQSHMSLHSGKSS